MIRKLYPLGKKKAFNVTYDDGVLQDIRFVQLLNQYGVKGTFNLNAALLATEFEWTHASGLMVKRLNPDAAAALYAGHEVASHTLTHPYMDNLTRAEILHELSADKASLERLFGREICGFAVPFDFYSDLVCQCVQDCGFAYARISEESCAFTPQTDFYRWRATAFHCCDGLENLTEQFIRTDEELALFQIVGHTYDLDVEDKWDMIERIFQHIRQQEDILPMTTIEIIDYLRAMRQAEITDDAIINHSEHWLWFDIGGTVCALEPHGRIPR